MYIQLENNDINAITSYNENTVLINGVTYSKSLIVSADTLIADWPVRSADDLDIAALEAVIQLKPEIILIAGKNFHPADFVQIQSQMHQQRIAFEVMTQDAAYRTYNVLLSEGRSAVICIIYA